ncbi:MAG: ComEC/Rec2 family competence protein [Candidatus Omnitrophota bacterium]
MRQAFCILTAAFCLGIVLASKIRMGFGFLFVLGLMAAVLSAASYKRGFRFNIFLICLVFLLGAVRLKVSVTQPQGHIRDYLNFKNNSQLTIRGFIVSEPFTKMGKTSFILRAQEVRQNNFQARSCGDILTYIKSGKDLHYGDTISLTGNLYGPLRSFGFRDYLARQNIYVVMKMQDISLVIKLGSNQGSPVKKFALMLKEKCNNIFYRYLSSASAGILGAMVLGEKRNVPPLVYNSMVKSGTVHILVVSGFNVGIVFFIVNLFLRLLRLKRRLRIYLSIPLLILYCLITGASNPVVRATVMGLILICVYLFKREADIFNSLAEAAAFILLLNPQQLFDVGFQLSFASVWAIAYIYPRIKSRLKLRYLQNKFLKYILEGLSVSVAAWVGTAGLVAYNFRIISAITVFANMLIVPLTTLITLSGFTLIFIGLLSPAVASVFALPTELLAVLLVRLSFFLTQIPGAYIYLPS